MLFDLVIMGNGFFVIVLEIMLCDFLFICVGQFKLDSDNFVVNSNGDNLLGFFVNFDGISVFVVLSIMELVCILDLLGLFV